MRYSRSSGELQGVVHGRSVMPSHPQFQHEDYRCHPCCSQVNLIVSLLGQTLWCQECCGARVSHGDPPQQYNLGCKNILRGVDSYEFVPHPLPMSFSQMSTLKVVSTHSENWHYGNCWAPLGFAACQNHSLCLIFILILMLTQVDLE